MREAAEQVWPAFWMPALTRNGSARSRSASANTSLRRFSPEFQRHRRDMARRRRLDQRPDRDRAGEGKVADAGMGGERRARLLAEAGNDVERAGRKTRFPRQIGERERGEAGFLRRLQDAGVAHRQRRADGAPGDLHRIVPRHDMPGHAMGLAQGVDRIAAEIGDGLAHDLVGGAGVKLHVARERQRVGAALLQGLADVERLDAGELVDPRADETGELREQPPALGRRETAPGPMKRALGRLDRRIDVGGCPTGDFADLDPARRVFDRQPRARSRLDPAPVDETLVDREPGEYVAVIYPPLRSGGGGPPGGRWWGRRQRPSRPPFALAIRRVVKTAHKIAHGYSHNRDALRFEPFRSPQIALWPIAHVVSDSIDLNREARPRAIEIERIGPDRVLTAKAGKSGLRARNRLHRRASGGESRRRSSRAWAIVLEGALIATSLRCPVCPRHQPCGRSPVLRKRGRISDQALPQTSSAISTRRASLIH